MFRLAFRGIAAMVAVLATMAFLAASADARINNGLSSGSRGSRTFSAPPPTATAPSASPFQRSVTQPGFNTAPRPGFGPSTTGGFFGRPGLLGGLAAGFLGAGLFGLLFGHGFLGGVGGLLSFLGLIFQLALIALVARFLWSYFQRRNFALAGAPLYRGAGPLQGLSPVNAGAASRRIDDVGITGADYDAFERALGEIQAAYSAEDIAALRGRATPEMVSYFSEDLAQNAGRGVSNKVAHVKLLQGDLAEAWREGNTEYATVAMRFSLNDWMVDRTSGAVVEGDPSRAQEVRELWTFRRSRGGPWMLSAIQQAG